MTITVDIKPEVRAELARQAAAHGSPVEAYAASLLEDALHLPAGAANNAEKQNPEGRKSLVRRPVMSGFLLDTNIPSGTDPAHA